MGFIGSFLGKVAGEAVYAGAELAKQKIADKKAANEVAAREAIKMTKYGKKARLNRDDFTPKELKSMGISYVDSTYSWRVEDFDGNNLTLVKIKGSEKGKTITVNSTKVTIAGE